MSWPGRLKIWNHIHRRRLGTFSSYEALCEFPRVSGSWGVSRSHRNLKFICPVGNLGNIVLNFEKGLKLSPPAVWVICKQDPGWSFWCHSLEGRGCPEGRQGALRAGRGGKDGGVLTINSVMFLIENFQFDHLAKNGEWRARQWLSSQFYSPPTCRGRSGRSATPWRVQRRGRGRGRRAAWCRASCRGAAGKPPPPQWLAASGSSPVGRRWQLWHHLGCQDIVIMACTTVHLRLNKGPPASMKRSGLRVESSQSKARLDLHSRSRLFSLPHLCTIACRLHTTGGGKWEAPSKSNLMKEKTIWDLKQLDCHGLWINWTSLQAWSPATSPPCCPGPSRGCRWGGEEAAKI